MADADQAEKSLARALEAPIAQYLDGTQDRPSPVRELAASLGWFEVAIFAKVRRRPDGSVEVREADVDLSVDLDDGP